MNHQRDSAMLALLGYIPVVAPFHYHLVYKLIREEYRTVTRTRGAWMPPETYHTYITLEEFNKYQSTWDNLPDYVVHHFVKYITRMPI